MYQFPVLLPQISNREDLLLTVSLFDDDTGDPVKMDGTTTALAQPFTGNNWTVTDGLIVTTSATAITIPTFPIVNTLSALALTVGVGLGILAGDFVVITDPTGLNTMSGTVLSYNVSTGALVCQIGFTFDFEIRRSRPGAHGNCYSGYSTSYDVGGSFDGGLLIAASLGNGISIVDVGIVQIWIPETSFGRLHPQTYSVAMVAFDGMNTRQMFVGQLPVVWGGMARNPKLQQVPNWDGGLSWTP